MYIHFGANRDKGSGGEGREIKLEGASDRVTLITRSAPVDVVTLPKITRALKRLYPIHHYLVAPYLLGKGYRWIALKVGNSLALDVGCGGGYLLSMLENAVGLDILPNLAKMAKQYKETVVGTATSLPFKDDSFEYVITATIMHHLSDEDRVKALREFRRVGKKYVFMEVMKEDCWAARILKALGARSFMKREQIEEAGFKIVELFPFKACTYLGLAVR